MDVRYEDLATIIFLKKNKIQSQFCKYILKLRSSNPNYVIYGELGRIPVDITIKLRMAVPGTSPFKILANYLVLCIRYCCTCLILKKLNLLGLIM